MDNRQRMFKILEILQEESDIDHPLTNIVLQQKLLLEYGISSDTRSIGEDIHALSEAGFISINSRAGTPLNMRGSFYDPFEDWELKILLDSVTQNTFLQKKDVEVLKRKLVTLDNKNKRADLARNVHMLDDDMYAQDDRFKNTLISLLEAIKQEKKVTFDYGKLDENKSFVLDSKATRKVSPYYITCSRAFFYLNGYPDAGEDIRTYRLDRMANINIIEEPSLSVARLPKGDSHGKVDALILNNTDNFIGDTIVVEIVWEGAPISVLYDVFSPSKVNKVPNQSGRFSIVTADNQGLFNNLLRLGDAVTVVSPPKVCKRYQEILASMVKKNTL